MKTASRRILFLIVAMIAFLLAGVIYAWSTIKAPFQTVLGWDGPDLQFNYTLTLIFFCLGGLLSGLISGKVSVRVRMLLSGILLCGGFVLTSVLRAEQLGLLYLAYGFMSGTGIGIAYNTLIAVTGAWFPDKKGLCSGCLMMAFGFSAMLIGKIATAGFGADLSGWRFTYFWLGIVIGLALIAAGFILRMPAAGETPAPVQKHTASVQTSDIAPRQMLKRPSFYQLFVFFFLLASVGSTAIGTAREVLASFGEETAALTVSVVGFISICNGLGRLASGAAFDAVGLRKTQYLTSTVAILAPLAVLISLWSGVNWLAIVGLCLCGFSYGFSPTVTVAFANAFYGTRFFAVNLPLLNLVLIPAAFMTTLGAAMPTVQTLFIVLTCFSVLGLAVNISIRHA